MPALQLTLHLATLAVAPILLVGIINRVKALWAGRRGPRLIQSWLDLVRLLRKTPVTSATTTWVFLAAPYLILATTLVAGLMGPLAPGFAPFGFPGDFVAFAYLLGCGRIPLMLSALDTGSSFEGMGASREATFSALAEPVLLFGLGTLGCLNQSMSFQDLVAAENLSAVDAAVRVAVAYGLFVVLLVEAGRVPVDDPATHLELTMVHEVMILDHSGPELAVLQYAGALKMTVLGAAVAAILNPVSVGSGGAGPAFAVSLGILAGLAALIGLIESLTARLRFRALPLFILSGFAAVVVAMIVVVADQGGLG